LLRMLRLPAILKTINHLNAIIPHMRTQLSTLLATSAVALGFISNAHAVTIGAGPGILLLVGANNASDTPTDGTTDQSRQNLDDSFTATLGAGTYIASSWSYNAGQTGSVIPYLAMSTGPNTYQVLAVGSQVDIVGGFGSDVTVTFGGSSEFTLGASTEIFAGIFNPPGAGSQNPITTNLASGSTVDHDNNADGLISPISVGAPVDGFGHADLARSYAFSIDVQPVPEPSSALFSMLGLAGLTILARRRR
jgi:hypothetical protein